MYLKTQQSFARNENDLEEANKIQAWFERFEQALRSLFEDDSITLKFDYKELNFQICQNNREAYGFDVLSDGYSAVLDIVINLLLRMEKHHKQAYDIEGIVVIDELENHLHIGLQKKILPFLTEFFPNIQFVISTHSPFILNSIDNAVIYDLENKQQVTDLSGFAYEGVVEGYFNIDQYSEKVKTRLARYEELVEKQEKTEEEKEEELELRGYLRNISSELAPEVSLAFNQIELERKNRLRMQRQEGEMINFTKTVPSQEVLDKLAAEKEKANGDYGLKEVLDAVEEEFHGKCYICEQKGLTSINVGHFIPSRKIW